MGKKEGNSMREKEEEKVEEYDVVVIGAGVVGISIARECVMRGVRSVCLVEQAKYPASLSSGGNSGIFHSGFDAPPSSMEVRCVATALLANWEREGGRSEGNEMSQKESDGNFFFDGQQVGR